MTHPVVGMVSFRFGPHDGVSVEARKWAAAFETLGFAIRWVAGDGDVDVAVPGLSIPTGSEDPAQPVPDGPAMERAVLAALDGCDLVVVENVLSLPLNEVALRAVATARRGRPTIVHHHDLAWQRPRFASAPPPPDDPAWAHVTINRRSAEELRERASIDATTIYNRFAPPTSPPRPVRAVESGSPPPLLLHPTRAIERKGVPAAIRLAEAVGGVYWLLGPAEDGYGERLEALLGAATCPVRRGSGGATIDELYDLADLVVFPSTWEGFGNPTIESAMARRPLAVADYPVLAELRAFGFRWLDASDHVTVLAWLREPDVGMIDDNDRIAREHFGIDGLPDALRSVLERVV